MTSSHRYSRSVVSVVITSHRRISHTCIHKHKHTHAHKHTHIHTHTHTHTHSTVTNKNVDMETLVDDFVTFYVAGMDMGKGHVIQGLVYVISNYQVRRRRQIHFHLQ